MPFFGKRTSPLSSSSSDRDDVEQILGVGAVDDGERFAKPERLRVEAQQAVGDRVERAAPDAAATPSCGLSRLQLGRGSSRPARVISAAARRVKVSSRIRAGRRRCAIRWATRWASVLVLPVPAPAMISSGVVERGVAAARCCGLSLSSRAHPWGDLSAALIRRTGATSSPTFGRRQGCFYPIGWCVKSKPAAFAAPLSSSPPLPLLLPSLRDS